jgi:hypothetical protein
MFQGMCMDYTIPPVQELAVVFVVKTIRNYKQILAGATHK